MNVFLDELEELQRNGFGTLKKVTRHSVLFFELSPSMVDTEVGPYSEFLRIAGQDVTMYNTIYRDVSNVSDELMEICRLHHPHSELLIEERII